jgi:ABC-type transport system involved in multi-copper enzyme maturation permease subunit
LLGGQVTVEAGKRLVNITTLFFGPLAGPECRRALRRDWLTVIRTLAAVAFLGVALIILWYWWLSQQIDPGHRPYGELRAGLTAVESMLVAVALVMGPAVLAGSLAGDRERGVLGLLLTTRVTPREIVAGRLAGKSVQVGMVLLAGIPAVVLLGALAGISASVLAASFLLPAAVAIGGGGLAVAASAVSRRGRDALLAVYLVDFLFLLSPLASRFGLPSEIYEWVGALNPFLCLYELAWHEDTSPTVNAVALWLGLGLLGASFAAWRLRPACLATSDGERVAKSRGRRGWVPPLGDRPMLWKELYIERVGTLGRFGRWLGLALVVALGGGSTALAAVIAWCRWVRPDSPWESTARDILHVSVNGAELYLSWLIQWAIGLRAAASISSEQERGTWDSLLTSPLTGREIVWGKLWGSLYAILWLIAAAVLAWTWALLCGVTSIGPYASWVAGLLVSSAFMAALGVRTSLSCRTATRALTVTVGLWLVSIVVVNIVAAIAIGSLFLIGFLAWSSALQAGLLTWTIPGWLLTAVWNVAWPVTRYAIYASTTVAIAGDTSLRFDRLAGRMVEGNIALAVDRIIHGRPLPPILLDAPSQREESVSEGV